VNNWTKQREEVRARVARGVEFYRSINGKVLLENRRPVETLKYGLRIYTLGNKDWIGFANKEK